MDATTGGTSGAPLYILKNEPSGPKAYVVAVHVGFINEDKGNCAVPICKHMQISTELETIDTYDYRTSRVNNLKFCSIC